MESECELCGRESQLMEVEIEGTVVLACERCASLGKEVRTAKPKKRNTRPKEPEIEEIVVENYGKLIKTRREQMNLTQEELARRIMEKSALIAKMEREEIKPTLELARKLERVLNIKLIEKIEHDSHIRDDESMRDKTVLTLGDLIKIKEKKK
jgi:putative transcription factor